MAVFRVERNTGYTVMSNHHLRNKELSLKAKGLLSQMLSLPEDSGESWMLPQGRPSGVSESWSWSWNRVAMAMAFPLGVV